MRYVSMFKLFAYNRAESWSIHLFNSLMVVSLAYIVLNCIYTKKSGAPLWLFKYKKNSTLRGRFSGVIMINSLLTFAILAFLTSGGEIGSRVHNWKVYVRHDPPSKVLLSQMLPWVPTFVQAWFFTVANLRATLAARTSPWSHRRPRLNPLIYNLFLLGFPVAYVAAVTASVRSGEDNYGPSLIPSLFTDVCFPCICQAR